MPAISKSYVAHIIVEREFMFENDLLTFACGSIQLQVRISAPCQIGVGYVLLLTDFLRCNETQSMGTIHVVIIIRFDVQGNRYCSSKHSQTIAGSSAACVTRPARHHGWGYGATRGATNVPRLQGHAAINACEASEHALRKATTIVVRSECRTSCRKEGMHGQL